MSSELLNEFQHEFQAEQTSRLRRRIYWFCAVNAAFGIPLLLVTLLWSRFSGENWREVVLWILSFSATVFTTGYAIYELLDVQRRERSRQEHLRRVSTFIAICGIVGSVNLFLYGVLDLRGWTLGLLAGQQVFSILFFHGLSCVFLPWTWQESLRPFLPMFLINAVGIAALWIIRRESFGMFDLFFLLLYGLTSVGAVMPGIGIASWRTNKFAQDFTLKAVTGRYGEMRRELSGAQRIHEQLFPRAETRGSIRLDYRYQPMRSIGGDYLYARFISTDDRLDPELLVLLLDVTGHGIPAALTVNRLYGELERLVAENPSISPTAALRALNRYCYLTLSDHSLFVTAVCFRVSRGPSASGEGTNATVTYANAGHPPSYLRTGVDLRPLEPTAMVLGVAKDLDVEIEDPQFSLVPGDVIIAYTDGAMEARDRRGRMFDSAGIVDAVVSSPSGGCICNDLLSAVTQHRYGPPTDDTLVVEIELLAQQPEAEPLATQARQAANTSAA